MVVLFVVYLVVQPFLIAILSAVVIAYLFYPVYRWGHKKLKKENLSAALCLILIVLVIMAPLMVLLLAITNELPEVYVVWKKYSTGATFNELCDAEPDHMLCKLYKNTLDFTTNERFGFSILSVEKVTDTVNKRLVSFIFSLPRRLLDAFIILFITFYLFKDGHLLINKIRRVMPLKESHKDRVLKRLNDVASATVYGQLMVALIQGIVAGIGYALFGIENFVILGTLTFFAALIPVAGTALVWVPIAFMKIVPALIADNQSGLMQGIMLIIYGIFIIGIIDNILKPKIIGQKARIHPAIVLVGVLGGLRVFGIIGVIVGPVLLAIFLMLIKIYEEEKSYSQG